MSRHYYYLAAQLPGLAYGQAMPMTSLMFKELAREHLTASDAEELDRCVLGEQSSGFGQAKSEFLKNWQKWETALRQNLAKNRAKNLRRKYEVSQDMAEYSYDTEEIAKAASAIESPLEAEIFLDKARWEIIENLQGIDAFSVNVIYAYMLKLLLMERRAAFNTEKGFIEYKKLYADILGDFK